MGEFDEAGRHSHRRARKGNVRKAILALLSEQPMHGYQMIQELSRRSGGAWTPSPGSIYPTLQMLEDEGLVKSRQSADGKRLFELTDEGRVEAARATDAGHPWEESGHGRRAFHVDLMMALRDAAIPLLYIAANGTEEQREKVSALLTELREKLDTVVPGAPWADPRGAWLSWPRSPRSSRSSGSGSSRSGSSRSGSSRHRRPERPPWARDGGWAFDVPSWLFGGAAGGPFGPGGIWGWNAEASEGASATAEAFDDEADDDIDDAIEPEDDDIDV
jgi:DNA-binding PadR family transcriptional regulator